MRGVNDELRRAGQESGDAWLRGGILWFDMA